MYFYDEKTATHSESTLKDNFQGRHEVGAEGWTGIEIALFMKSGIRVLRAFSRKFEREQFKAN